MSHLNRTKLSLLFFSAAVLICCKPEVKPLSEGSWRGVFILAENEIPFLFEVNGQLIANEFAPRVHNSGHWTIEGTETSQFENHLRAIIDLPLGATTAVGKAAMVNFIGGLPTIEELLAIPHVHLHLYDKEPRKGRKVAHATIRAETTEQLNELVMQVSALADQVDDC